jgi:hypothetical protein
MVTVDDVELLPDTEQHALLKATLERVNRASNAARAATVADMLHVALRDSPRSSLEKGARWMRDAVRT